jgi:hypothetical protein
MCAASARVWTARGAGGWAHDRLQGLRRARWPARMRSPLA